jgi:hypothetical protein
MPGSSGWHARVASSRPPKAAGLAPLADDRQGVVEGIDPHFLRHRVGAEQAVPELAHLDPAVRHCPQFADPGAHGVEAVGHLLRTRPFQRQLAPWKHSARR